MTTPNPTRIMIREGQYFSDVARTFAGAPDFKCDSAVAISDERPDGGIHVAGFLASTGVSWNGVIFRIGDPMLLGSADEHKEPPPPPPEQPPLEAEAEGESQQHESPPPPPSENPPPENPPPEGDGDGEGEDEDELLKLIHSIAADRDDLVMQELAPALAEHLQEQLKRHMDELAARTDARLEEIAERGLGIRTIIEVNEVEKVTLPDGELSHKDLALVLALVRSGAKNVMLVGPAGCGKTTLARQVAFALGHERFAALSCSPGMSEAKVLGRLGVPTEKNETGYHETAVMHAFRHGGTILFDEMDNADASMMVSFNAMTDGGFATLPTGETVPRHPDTVIVAACNTFGHGADRLYVGRNQLDAATLDRFVGATVEMDYDADLERKLVPEGHVREAVWAIRKKARKHGLRRVVSTRALLAARRRHLGMGEPLPQVLKQLTLGWSQQDRAAVEVT